MSTHPLKTLLALWEHSKVTMEQIIGHILQHLSNHEDRLRSLEKQAGRPLQEG
jgi:flagellar biosynthesis chaperone FliJ